MERIGKTGLGAILWWALVGCGSDVDSRTADFPLSQELIVFTPMYSAYGGSQTYSVTPYVPAAVGAEEDDPLILSSVEWQVDERYLERADFPAIQAAIKLTTKRAGVTALSMTATTLHGDRVRAVSSVQISEASDEDWEKGDRYYSIDNKGFAVDGRSGVRPNCGLNLDSRSELPKGASCQTCHNKSAAAVTEVPTPTQTAGYSDERLIAMVTQGQPPDGYTFTSWFLTTLPEPSCIYSTMHIWQMDADTQRGMVLKLRSLPPAAVREVDRLKPLEMQMEMRMRASPP